MDIKEERMEEVQNFFEAMEALSQKEREDADFDLMKKAVASIWANLKATDTEDEKQ